MAATATLSRSVLEADDNAAQELAAVFSRCRSSFHRTAFRCLGNAADAEDAVQDALLSAYKHREQFRGQSQLPTWITAIVLNAARMQLRTRRRLSLLSLNQESEEAETSLLNLLSDPRPNPEEECRAYELAERTGHLMALLSPLLREAIELREVKGLAIREIADSLGLPEGTVKARLSRARTKLRQLVRRTIGRRMSTRVVAKTSVTETTGELSAIRT